MAQQLRTTGAMPVYTGTGSSDIRKKIAELFGYTVGRPQITLYEAAEPVHCDIAGSIIPFDFCWQGQWAVISATFTRWEESVLTKLRKRPDYANSTAGRWESYQVGTLMAQENMTYPIWLPFPRAASVAAMADLPAGYRFWNTFMQGPLAIQGGASSGMVTLTWYAFPAFQTGTYPASTSGNASCSPIAGGANARYTLYDNTMLYSADFGVTTAALPSAT